MQTWKGAKTRQTWLGFQSNKIKTVLIVNHFITLVGKVVDILFLGVLIWETLQITFKHRGVEKHNFARILKGK